MKFSTGWLGRANRAARPESTAQAESQNPELCHVRVFSLVARGCQWLCSSGLFMRHGFSWSADFMFKHGDPADHPRWGPPFLLYLGRAADDLAIKTARGLAYWRPEWCIGQYRDPG